MERLDELLQRFGKAQWRPLQRELACAGLEGKSSLGVFPTGYGKSICYQIPCELLPGLSIVISPLIALMKDQVQGLVGMGIKAERYDSSLSEEEKSALFAKLSEGNVKILFLAPESLENPMIREVLQKRDLGLLVIDEAHCLSEWGHSFRPDYLSIPQFARQYPFHAVMALTATAHAHVRQDLMRHFDIDDQHAYVLPPYKAQLIRQLKIVDSSERLSSIVDVLSEESLRPSIVYVQSRKETDEVCYALNKHGLNCRSYHAGMSAESRLSIQDDFLTDQVDVLVATIAFGMGVDKSNVRSVIHYDPPTSIEGYVQESGRAGRDLATAHSIVFLTPDDNRKMRCRIGAGLSDPSALLNVLRLFCEARESVISLYETMTQFDIPDIRLSRMIYDLQSLSLIEVKSKGLKNYQVKALFPLEEILSGRESREVEYLTWLSAHPKGSVEEFAEAHQFSWNEAQEWFQDLVQTGEWTVKLTQQSVLVSAAAGAAAWLRESGKEYIQHLNEACKRDWVRWQQWREMLGHKECLNKQIDLYFCDTTELVACGHCPACTQKISLPQDASSPQELSEDDYVQVSELLKRRSVALKTPLQLTRFLLGYSSPASLRARLWSQSLYGCLDGWAWDDVMTQSKSLMGNR